MVSIGVTIFVALLSSSSVWISAIITNRSSENRMKIQAKFDLDKEKNALKLQKCEQIYTGLLEYQISIFNAHMQYILFIAGEISLDELNKKAFSENGMEFRAILATAGVYFPEVYEDIAISRKLLKPANDAFFAARDGRLKDLNKAKADVLNSGQEFDNAIKLVLKKISNIADF